MVVCHPEPSFREFIRVAWSDLSSRVSGGLSVPFTALALFRPGYERIVWGVLVVLSVVAMTYRVWSKERELVCALEDVRGRERRRAKPSEILGKLLEEGNQGLARK